MVDQEAVGCAQESREIGVPGEQAEVLLGWEEWALRLVGDQGSHDEVVALHHVKFLANLLDAPDLAPLDASGLGRRQGFPPHTV